MHRRDIYTGTLKWVSTSHLYILPLFVCSNYKWAGLVLSSHAECMRRRFSSAGRREIRAAKSVCVVCRFKTHVIVSNACGGLPS